MTNLLWRLLVVGLILPVSIISCTTPLPAPVTEYGKAPADLAFPPSLLVSDGVPQTVPKTSAVSALLNDAVQKIKTGDLEGAVTVLERTLRIEPRNPLLWSELASVRYQQGEYEQAEQLAGKSNLFAVEDVFLQKLNWQIIAQVRRRHGNAAGADQAEQRLQMLR